MVVIGFDKKHSVNDIASFLQNYNTVIYDKVTFSNLIKKTDLDKLSDIDLYEIETEMLSKNWLCCWGELTPFNLTHEHLHTRPERADILQRRIRLYNEDISFWKTFVNDFVDRYNNIALFRYYSDVNLPVTVEEMSPTQLTQEKLLEMECNQIFLISK
ncbi:MAG: hypothetical protein IJY33_01945 [Oscillospiraceae bacterium]|nr:hypothetical protein [Oscillospiraceae bacterium]